MPQPTQSDLHVNALLTNFSIMFQQPADGFVAEKVFPFVPVLKQSDRYAVHSRADFNRNVVRKRAASTESSGGGYKVDTTPTYFCDVWSHHKDIDDQVRANADSVFNLDSDATIWLTGLHRIAREVDWAAKFFAASLWTSTLTGVASAPGANQTLQWNDMNSSPIVDVRNAKRMVQLASGGYRPNVGVMGRQVFDTLIDHPDFVDRVKYGQSPGPVAKVALDAMAAVFELDEILVMDAIINNGVEGVTLNANESNAFIGGKSMLLVHRAARVGLDTPTAGVTFAWTGYFGATGMGTRMKSFYIPQIESTRVEMDAAYAHKLVSADMGIWLATIIA
jgi:hypothetical protein